MTTIAKPSNSSSSTSSSATNSSHSGSSTSLSSPAILVPNLLVDTRDGQSYQTSQIGNQIWMTQNLNFGNQIQSAGDSSIQQISTGTQKWCYNDSASNCTKNGALYQWHEIMNLPPACDSNPSPACNPTGQIQGICPSNWHIPSQNDFMILANTVGNHGFIDSLITLDTSSTNPSQISALGTGIYNNTGFNGRDSLAAYWTSTINSPSSAMAIQIALIPPSNRSGAIIRNQGLALRCVHN